MKVGGWGSFVEAAPEGFLAPVVEDYSAWFLISWMIVNFFVFAADWSFVQRWVCVPTAKDAKKAAHLIGILYLVSPIFWMLPPLIYRVVNQSADTEQAYILACQYVLPAGMMGLMVAAMASATASMATTRLNVFAGAFTEAYHNMMGKGASEKRLVFVGRMITLILGIVVIGGALMIPKYGYTKFIVDINKLLYVPLFLPTVWGLFSRKIGISLLYMGDDGYWLCNCLSDAIWFGRRGPFRGYGYLEADRSLDWGKLGFRGYDWRNCCAFCYPYGPRVAGKT